MKTGVRHGASFLLAFVVVIAGCGVSDRKISSVVLSHETVYQDIVRMVDSASAARLLPLLSKSERTRYHLDEGRLQKLLDFYKSTLSGLDEGPVVVVGDEDHGAGTVIYRRHGVVATYFMLEETFVAGDDKGANVVDGIIDAISIEAGHGSQSALDMSSKASVVTVQLDGEKKLRHKFESMGIDRRCNTKNSTDPCHSWDEQFSRMTKTLELLASRKANGAEGH